MKKLLFAALAFLSLTGIANAQRGYNTNGLRFRSTWANRLSVCNATDPCLWVKDDGILHFTYGNGTDYPLNFTLSGNVIIGDASSTVTYNGGAIVKTNPQAVSYNATASDYTILITSTAASRVVTLPDNATAGTVYVIKDTSGTCDPTHTITVKGTTDTVDGVLGGYVINSAYGSISVISDGSNWFTL